MKVELFVLENKKLKPQSESMLTLIDYENEFGSYSEITGEFNIGIKDESINIKTKTLIGDLYSLFYSINDYFEFEFASTTLDDEKITFTYSKASKDELLLKTLDKEIVMNKILFFEELLKKIKYFFTQLKDKYSSNEEYIMYLNIIERLESKVMSHKNK